MPVSTVCEVCSDAHQNRKNVCVRSLHVAFHHACNIFDCKPKRCHLSITHACTHCTTSFSIRAAICLNHTHARARARTLAQIFMHTVQVSESGILSCSRIITITADRITHTRKCQRHSTSRGQSSKEIAYQNYVRRSHARGKARLSHQNT